MEPASIEAVQPQLSSKHTGNCKADVLVSADQDKVQALMLSIEEVGLKEPIDVLEVEGDYYGFSGCHRYEVRPCRAPACKWLDQDSTQRQALKVKLPRVACGAPHLR